VTTPDACEAGASPCRRNTEATSARRASLTDVEVPDVVVALDGWRVRTLHEHYAIRSFDDDPDFLPIVWRDGKYLEVAARRLFRSFGVDMSDYPPHPK
jgi:hypothetical protein